MSGQKVQTHVVNRTNSPQWNETFTLFLHSFEKEKLQIKVRNKTSVGRNEHIGEIIVPIDFLFLHSCTENLELPIGGAPSGKLLLALTYLSIPKLSAPKRLYLFDSAASFSPLLTNWANPPTLTVAKDSLSSGCSSSDIAATVGATQQESASEGSPRRPHVETEEDDMAILYFTPRHLENYNEPLDALSSASSASEAVEREGESSISGEQVLQQEKPCESIRDVDLSKDCSNSGSSASIAKETTIESSQRQNDHDTTVRATTVDWPIVIRGLSDRVEESDLRDVVNVFGTVISFKLQDDCSTTVSSPSCDNQASPSSSALISYAREDESVKAVTALDGRRFYGGILSVALVKNESEAVADNRMRALRRQSTKLSFSPKLVTKTKKSFEPSALVVEVLSASNLELKSASPIRIRVASDEEAFFTRNIVGTASHSFNESFVFSLKKQCYTTRDTEEWFSRSSDASNDKEIPTIHLLIVKADKCLGNASVKVPPITADKATDVSVDVDNVKGANVTLRFSVLQSPSRHPIHADLQLPKEGEVTVSLNAVTDARLILPNEVLFCTLHSGTNHLRTSFLRSWPDDDTEDGDVGNKYSDCVGRKDFAWKKGAEVLRLLRDEAVDGKLYIAFWSVRLEKVANMRKWTSSHTAKMGLPSIDVDGVSVRSDSFRFLGGATVSLEEFEHRTVNSITSSLITPVKILLRWSKLLRTTYRRTCIAPTPHPCQQHHIALPFRDEDGDRIAELFLTLRMGIPAQKSPISRTITMNKTAGSDSSADMSTAEEEIRSSLGEESAHSVALSVITLERAATTLSSMFAAILRIPHIHTTLVPILAIAFLIGSYSCFSLLPCILVTFLVMDLALTDDKKWHCRRVSTAHSVDATLNDRLSRTEDQKLFERLAVNAPHLAGCLKWIASLCVILEMFKNISLIDDPMTRQAWALFATTSCFMFAWYPATTSLVFGALVCIPSLRHTLTSNSFYHLSSPSTDFEVAAAHQRSSFWRSPLGPRLLTKQCPLSLRRLQEGGEVAVAGLSGP